MSEDGKPASDAEDAEEAAEASEAETDAPAAEATDAAAETDGPEAETPAAAADAEAPEDPSKRKFITVATHAIGVCVTCAVAVPTLGVVLHPLIADAADDAGDGFVRVGSVGRFTPEAPFQRVVVKQDRSDAWVRTRGVPVGSILVQRGKNDTFTVFSAKCPHLGCAVNPVAGESRFQCPCHNSSFGLDGTKTEMTEGGSNPAPRGLDALEWRVVSGELQVKYVSYKTGTKDQVAIG